MHIRHILSATLLGVVTVASTRAATKTWEGANDYWSTAAAWDADGVPNTSTPLDTVVINAGTVTYKPTTDFVLNSTMTIGGSGTWFQSTTTGDGNLAAWIKIGQNTTTKVGTLNVNTGGTFNTGDCSQLIIGDGGTGNLNVAGGSVVVKTGVAVNVNNASTLSLSSNGSLSAGTLNANGTSQFSLGAGTVTVNSMAVVSTATLNNTAATTTTGSLTWNGALNISGGTMNVTGSLTGTTGSLNVNGGTFTRSGGTLDILLTRSLNVSGGTLNVVNNEIKIKGPGLATVSGGTVNANIIAFDGTTTDPAFLTFSGGTINLTPTTFQGIFTTGVQDYIDFTGSSATLFIAGLTSTQANTLVTDGRLRHNGVTAAADFTVTQITGPTAGYQFTLVPEPASLSLLAMAGFAALRRRRGVTRTPF